jgi:hypothetical protein
MIKSYFNFNSDGRSVSTKLLSMQYFCYSYHYSSLFYHAIFAWKGHHQQIFSFSRVDLLELSFFCCKNCDQFFREAGTSTSTSNDSGVFVMRSRGSWFFPYGITVRVRSTFSRGYSECVCVNLASPQQAGVSQTYYVKCYLRFYYFLVDRVFFFLIRCVYSPEFFVSP